MATQVQLRRGTTSEHENFVGANGEVTVDTDKNILVVHDGSTAGGFPITGGVIGSIVYFAFNTTPDGWLKANGAEVSRSTYADLFDAIGETFGAGDGSTTFELPDLRGEFVRGMDNGRGVDSGRSFGTAQLDQMQKMTGSVSEVIFRNRSTPQGAIGINEGGSTGTSSGTTLPRRTIVFDSADSPNARVSDTTDGETRPRNIALLACIKY